MHWATSTIVCHNLTKLIGYYIPTIMLNINALGYQYYSMSQPKKSDRILYTNDAKHKCTGLPVL